jgi:hypothetical protein
MALIWYVTLFLSFFFIIPSIIFMKKHLRDSMKVNMNLKGRHRPFSTVSYLLGVPGCKETGIIEDSDVKKVFNHFNLHVPAGFKLRISDTVYICPKLIEIWQLS